MAMGLTLTYMTTKVPNFAYGDMVVIGIYSAYTTVEVYGSNPYVGSLVGFVIAGLASVAMYLLVLRPLARRGSSIVSLMIATFGVDIGFAGVFGIYTDYLSNAHPFLYPKEFYTLQGDFSLAGNPGINFSAPALMVVTILAVFLLLTRTRFGVAMRAAIENPPLAKVLGINVDFVYTISWFLAGGLAGLAGALLTLEYPLLSVNSGNDIIIAIFAASVLGGLTSIFGSAVGGLVIGASTSLMTIWLGSGFGYVGTGIIAALFMLGGVYMLRMKPIRRRIMGAILAVLGGWIAVDVAAGSPVNFLGPQILNGFGAQIINPLENGIPLVIMAVALLIIPQGIFSLDFRRLLHLEKK